MGDFSEQVFDQVRRIPAGKVATYGQIARLVGRPRSARYVGFALRANPKPGAESGSVPCHRVVFKDGSLCRGYAFGGPEVQRVMLAEEGVVFVEDGRVDMEACAWNPAESARDEGACGEGAWRGKGDEHGEGERHVACDPVGFACASEPTAPPPDFDWARELGDC